MFYSPFIIYLILVNTEKLSLHFCHFGFQISFLIYRHKGTLFGPGIFVDLSSECCVFFGNKKMSQDVSFATGYASIVVYIWLDIVPLK